MLEEFASEYVNQYPLPHWLSVYGLIVAGGLIGWIWSALSGRRATLGPVPFFVRLCLAILIVCVVELVSIKGKEAIAWNVATRLAVLLAASSLIGGVYIGRIAAARSQDAFGHLNGTPLAFIPVANLLLACMASETRTTPRFGLTHGEEGAVFGLILLALAGGAGWTWSVPRGDLSDVLDLMKAANVAYIQKVIREDGLEKALEGEAEVARRSPDYNSDYYYAAAEVEKDVITFTLQAREPGQSANEDVLRERRSKVCDDAGVAEILKAGATFRTIFIDSSGRKEATVTTTAGDCTFPPSLQPWWTKSIAELRWPNALTLEGETASEQALSFLILPDSRIWLASLALMMLGGLGSAIVRSKGTLGRAPYFLGNCGLVLVAEGSRALLIPTAVLVANGHMGFMAALWALVQVACGIVLWRFAARRSRDVHGHAKAAPLAFVPIANLWLLVAAPPRKQAHDLVSRPDVSAWAVVSVVIGVGLVGPAIIATKEIDRRMELALRGGEDVPERVWTQYLVNKHGIDGALAVVAAAFEPRDPKPGTTWLIARTAGGATLRERYVVQIEDPVFDDDARRRFIQAECNFEGDQPLLNAGATIEQVVVDRHEQELGRLAITAKDCGL